MKALNFLISTLMLVLFFFTYKILYSGSNVSSETRSEKINQSECVTDWHKCKNLDQLFNEYNKISEFEYDCKYLSEDTLQYGPPEWKGFPYKPFEYHYKSTNFLKTGYIVLIEPGALVPNRYGGKEIQKLECYVNLKNSKPDKIIMPNE